MEKNNITLSADAKAVIECLQHQCGTYDYYRSTLDRLFNFILLQGDEIGMGDMESIQTLRALACLKTDLATLAGKNAVNPAETPDLDALTDKGTAQLLKSAPAVSDPDVDAMLDEALRNAGILAGKEDEEK